MDIHGQVIPTDVTALSIGIIVSLMLACVIVYNVGIAVKPEEAYDYTTTQLLNTNFSENTSPTVPSHWDNSRQGTVAVNEWDNANFWITVTSTENDTTTIDNGYFKQSLTMLDFDTLTSATTTFSFMVYDNDNAQSMMVRVILNDGVDNHTIFSDNVTQQESAAWTTVENDVSDYVTGSGTYTLFLRAELIGKSASWGTANLVVRFDDANLTIDSGTYTAEYLDAVTHGENIWALSWAGIGLMSVAIVIIAAMTILRVVRGGLGSGGI